MPPKQRYVRIEGFEEESLSALLDAYEAWATDQGEEDFIDHQFQVEGDTYTLLIFYTEG